MTRIEAIRAARWDRRREIKAARLVICGVGGEFFAIQMNRYRRGDVRHSGDVLWSGLTHQQLLQHLGSLDPKRLP